MKKLIIILGVVGAAFSAIFARMSTMPAAVLVLYRMVFALIGICPGLIIGRRDEIKKLDIKKITPCIISGICLGCHFICYFESLAYTSIASSVVLVDTEIFFVAIGSILLFKERMTVPGWLSIIITFIGSMVVAGGDILNGNILGDILALVGAIFVSVYTVLGKTARKYMSTSAYTSIVYACAGLVAFLFSIIKGYSFEIGTINNWIAAVGTAVFCTLLGHSIFSWGLKYEKAAFISIAKLLEPIFATILGLIIFNEVTSLTSCIGGVLIIAGIIAFTLLNIRESE